MIRTKRRKTATTQKPPTRAPTKKALAARGPTKGQRTQARLVAAAIEEFGARGFERTTVTHIVKRAGVSQPAFYLYFSSKNQIYQHLVKRVRNELREVIEGARVPPHLPEKRASDSVRDAVKAFLQYFVDNPKLSSIGYFEADGSAAIRDEVAVFVARNVEAERSAGYFRSNFDVLFVSECYNGSLDRVIKNYLLTRKATASQLADWVTDIYLNGLVPKRT